MAADDDRHVPRFGEDYDLTRWTDGSEDADGRLIWHDTVPTNDEWEHVSLVTINLNPDGEPDYRNVEIGLDRPLDPWGTYDPDDPYYFDLDDLIGEIMDAYGLDF